MTITFTFEFHIERIRGEKTQFLKHLKMFNDWTVIGVNVPFPNEHITLRVIK